MERTRHHLKCVPGLELPLPELEWLTFGARLTRDGQLYQRIEPTALDRGSVHGGAVTKKRDPSERSKFEHRTSIAASLSGRGGRR